MSRVPRGAAMSVAACPAAPAAAAVVVAYAAGAIIGESQPVLE